MYNFKTELEPFARGFINCESDSKFTKMASGFKEAAKYMNIEFDDEKGFVYLAFDTAFAMGNSESVYYHWWRMRDIEQEHPEAKEDFDYIREQMEPQLCHHRLRENCFTEEQNENWAEGNYWGGTWMGHSNPDFADIATFGTDYYREYTAKYRALNPGKDDFYDGIEMMLDGLDIIGKRTYDAACARLDDEELDDATKKRVEAIRDTFDHAPKQPCRDFVEGSIMFWFIYSLDGIDSPGHFDQYMYDFWKVTEPAIRREYLEATWERFHETRSWNLCISGSDENWNDLTNDLSYEILEVTEKFKYQTPNLTMRCHRNTPEKLLRAAYKAIATGCGMPTLYNDEAVCPALERLGIPPCDSHRYVMNGCNQIDIQGKSHMGLEDGEVFITRAVEMTLYNGIIPKSGKDLGLHTGDPRDFATFDEFYDAFMKQLDNLIDGSCAMAVASQKYYAIHAPNPLRSILIDGCIERGRDYKDQGPLYGHAQILAEGIADTADSLAAIKKYVYEDKKYTMAELIDALDKDFEGYDDMYMTLKNSELKFGNDIDYVDSIAKDVVDHFNARLLTIPTARGGYFSGGCSPFNRAAGYGIRLGALPNGKKKDEHLLADSIGATPGFDKNGPTALLNSCLKFDHTLPGSGFILNVKFDKNLFNTEAGEESFLGLCNSYFSRKGQQLSISVVSSDELLDAQVHPENHQDLIVRVGGYSDYFVDLPTDLQENVIARTMLST